MPFFSFSYVRIYGINFICTNIRFTPLYMYEEHLALNNLKWSICHKIKPNQTLLDHIDTESNVNEGLLQIP